jgi:hypothetical protein
MITFWVHGAGAFGITNYLADRGLPLRDRFTVRRYEWTADTLTVPSGPQVFSSLDQLTAEEREGAGSLRGQLAGLLPEQQLLNDPSRSLLRPALLAALAERGLNSFRGYPAQEADRVTRFPVFLRGAHNHDGSLTGLLGSREEVRRALLTLRLHGYRRADLLIVEFCDTSDSHGIFRKYSAYRVGQAVIPAHLLAGRQWMMKSETAERTLELVQEDAAFVERNPHEAWLQEVFRLAHIEYGRIDYGVLGDRPQAWEINLNPTIGRAPGRAARAMEPAVAEIWERSRRLAHGRLREAFAALDRESTATPIALRLDAALRARIATASRRRRRQQVAHELFKRAYHSPLGAPLRALLPPIP